MVSGYPGTGSLNQEEGMHRECSVPGRFARVAYAVAQAGLWTLLALLGAQSLAAQDSEPPAVEDRLRGFRLTYGVSLAKPFLDQRAQGPFAAIGEFRAGPGIQIGVGYGLHRWEVAATADFAGLDVGEPFERDGIAMGRRTSILRAFGVEARWSPPGSEMRGWRPWVGGGYVRSALDNVLVRRDQLPASLRDSPRTVEAANETEPAGIAGSGIRAGVGAERDLTPSLALRLHVAGDYVRYHRFIYGVGDFTWDGGTGWIPRLSAALRWAP